MPHSYNQPVIDLWNSDEGSKYNVLANHDIDDGFRKEETLAWWGMKKCYHAFESQGFHFVVLDGNKKDSPWVGSIDAEQQEGLKQDLAGTTNPTL